jgi:hypothetical protein
MCFNVRFPEPFLVSINHRICHLTICVIIGLKCPRYTFTITQPQADVHYNLTKLNPSIVATNQSKDKVVAKSVLSKDEVRLFTKITKKNQTNQQ